MNEWERTSTELSKYDVNTLFDSQFGGITAVNIAELILTFFGNVPLPKDFLAQCDDCITEINQIYLKIYANVMSEHGKVTITQIFTYLSNENHKPYSTALNELLAPMGLT